MKKKTLIDFAKDGIVTEEMKEAASYELDVSPEEVMKGLAEGRVIIMTNSISARAEKKKYAVGAGLTTKVNANIGTSQDFSDIEYEMQKLRVAVEAGAHAVMDLSTGGNLKRIRKLVVENSTIPVGTVPVYDVLNRYDGTNIKNIKADDFFDAIEKHAEAGIDFITVHAGITAEAVMKIKREGRLNGIVSRGGAFHAHWMVENDAENPLFADFDRLVEIARRYDIVLSLGDGLRPGALADATDRGQIAELINLGELQKRALEAGVQVMIEGPGHVPMDEIEANMILQKRLCGGAPFYVLGPLVTDVAPGYDHIVSAIGGAIAARAGADFLCYVTPAEHLGLPSAGDVREGVIASRIAAHAADIVKLGDKAKAWDMEFSEYRRKRDWQKQIELAMDGKKAEKFLKDKKPFLEDTCTMCGKYCSYRLNEETFSRI